MGLMTPSRKNMPGLMRRKQPIIRDWKESNGGIEEYGGGPLWRRGPVFGCANEEEIKYITIPRLLLDFSVTVKVKNDMR